MYITDLSFRELDYKFSDKTITLSCEPHTPITEISSDSFLNHLLTDLTEKYQEKRKQTAEQKKTSLMIVELLLRERKSWLHPTNKKALALVKNLIRQNEHQV